MRISLTPGNFGDVPSLLQVLCQLLDKNVFSQESLAPNLGPNSLLTERLKKIFKP